MGSRLLVIVTALAADAALGAVEGPGREQEIPAARAAGPVEIDGKLDDAAWAAAPVFEDFVQLFPTPGAPPSERTELRVLYDDAFVYVAVVAHDASPDLINQRLGRRDSDPFSDAIDVVIDPTHDHQTGYLFYLNAAGVQGDGLLFDDRNFTEDWDGVWEGASTVGDTGWTAEFAIPLSLLRFPERPVQTWGFGVRRKIARRNEEIASVLNPRTTNAVVSRLGHLTGLQGLRPKRSVELMPYLAARTTLRPQYSDGRASPRLLVPTGDVGLDVKLPLTSNLTLTGTINPDFGQVEADRIILNLSTFENFFPEKRPFFTQGMELFQPVGGGDGQLMALFYSRRIGIAAPILAAAKLTGTVAEGVEVGLLDAFVVSPEQGAVDEENPDRRFQFHLERPFHLGPNSELPAVAPAPTNYLAAVTRASVGKNSWVGGMFTAATPLAGPCVDADSPECLTVGGNAAALRFDLKTTDSAFGAYGQIVGSQVVGGPDVRVLRDGTALQRGGFGSGALFRLGKFGGEGFRWDAGYDYASPTLFLEATGFQHIQNDHAPRAAVRYQRQTGLGDFKGLWVNLGGGTRFTSDGRALNKGSWINFNTRLQLPTFDFVGFEAGYNHGAYDVREIASTGIPLQRLNGGFVVLFGSSNPNNPVVVEGYAAAGMRTNALIEDNSGYQAQVTVSWRPHDAVVSSLEVFTDRTTHGPRYVETRTPTEFLFGELESEVLSLTLRQQVLFSPKLSLQVYAQLFSAYGAYGPYYLGTSDAARAPITLASLTPTSDPGGHDFYSTQMNVNAVLRWEYALGSTLFFVYTRSQSGVPPAEVPQTLVPVNLLSGPATDAAMIKWSWYWT